MRNCDSISMNPVMVPATNGGSATQVEDDPRVTLARFPGLLRCWEKFESYKRNDKEFRKSRAYVAWYHITNSAIRGPYASVKEALHTFEVIRLHLHVDWNETLVIDVDKEGNAKPLLEISLSGWNSFAKQRIEEWKSKNNPLAPLDLYHYRLKDLPPLPDNVQILYCGYNQLTSLPDLPKSLKNLSCDGNNLTTLPKLPDGLIKLDCGHIYFNFFLCLEDKIYYLN